MVTQDVGMGRRVFTRTTRSARQHVDDKLVLRGSGEGWASTFLNRAGDRSFANTYILINIYWLYFHGFLLLPAASSSFCACRCGHRRRRRTKPLKLPT